MDQPQWATPARQAEEPVLKLYNSFTRTKTEFVPTTGRHVKWYNCGPTVYDASHMGHARNYVTQDILHRIMSDYFGYDVHFVMNITDIDDKIILRARQQFLFNKFKKETTALNSELVDTVRQAWEAYIRSELARGLVEAERPSEGEEEARWANLVERFADKTWKQECLQRNEKFEMHFTAARRSMEALQKARTQLSGQTNTSLEAAHALIDASQDILCLSLDKQLKATVTDPSIFRSLAAFWEDAFFKDMDRLRVLRPDTLTRVTEFVPEITQFVEKIISNGYGYESEGSVYFDTHAFDGSEGHFYAKLEPWSKGNKKLMEEGEGALTSTTTGQRSKSDFVLWKSSKPGEPSWPSPWGPGRPGWHIECSVMASAILGDNMDIHSGGVDLAFPHHDNEIAQSEAYHGCDSWVNYFLHTGHLHIEGLKMSKSLKNFITIDEILQKYTARQLRLAFLSQLWNAKVDFSEGLMTGEVRTIEQNLNNFFTTIKALQSRSDGTKSDGYHHYEKQEAELTSSFHESQSAFRSALCDSFNTPSALLVLRELVSKTNTYIAGRGKDINVDLLVYIANWVGRMLRMFGLGEGSAASSEIGWGQEDREGGSGSVNREEVLMPYLRTLSTFRDGIRQLAIGGKDDSETALKEILMLCDRLRDSDLVPLGVALDDQEDGKALVKLVSPAELIRARDEKRAIQDAKIAKKAAALEAERLKKAQKLEKGKVSPKEMFRPPNVKEGVYGTWNEQGVPLTDGEGKELSKNAVKKVMKDFAAQGKAHEEYLASTRTD